MFNIRLRFYPGNLIGFQNVTSVVSEDVHRCKILRSPRGLQNLIPMKPISEVGFMHLGIMLNPRVDP